MPKPKLWNWEVSESVPLIYIALSGERQRKYGAVGGIQEDKKNEKHIKVEHAWCWSVKFQSIL